MELTNIQHYLEQQASVHPGKIAVTLFDKHLTFAQLNEESNRFAHALISKEVEPGGLIPICMDRSFEMVVSIFGVLKARCGYVPVDTAYPRERINFILTDIAARFAICSQRTRANLEGFEQLTVIELDSTFGSITEFPVKNLAIGATVKDLAYVIYTSGSTGKPKGAIVDQAAIMNKLLWNSAYFNFTPEDSYLQKTIFSFDVSVVELLGTVISGSRLVLAKPIGQLENDYIKYIIEKERITICHFSPSNLNLFLTAIQPGDCASLQRVFCSGEALKVHHVDNFRKVLGHARLYNLYGPTETAVEVTCYEATALPADAATVPIGPPIDNVSIVIVDEHLRPVPAGSPGELLIGGVAVANGYVNRPELTLLKFIDGKNAGLENMRYYRTGDNARYNADGDIEFLGRFDDQVKIAGVRIELFEIETVLETHNNIARAVVLAKETHAGFKRLVCYLQADGPFDRAETIAFLLDRLPEYMVPSVWVVLPEMPLNPSGKVDKKALPEIQKILLERENYAEAETDTEKELIAIWEDVLETENMGINDHFLEVGGNSLLAVALINAINKKKGTSLTLKNLYTYPNIKELGAFVDNNSVPAAAELDATKKEGGMFGFFKKIIGGKQNQPTTL
jgi:amino acid adenylation domain-containing protein